VHDILVDIQITSDEPLAGYFASKFIEAGFKPKIEKMETGDFIIFGKKRKNAILIERKSPQDFLGSIEGKKDSFGAWEIIRDSLYTGRKDSLRTEYGEL